MNTFVATHLRRHSVNGLAALAAVSLLATSGCAADSAPAGSTPGSPGETSPATTSPAPASSSGTAVPGVSAQALAFWRPAETVIADEIDPPQSLTDLADRATLVVRGPVASADPQTAPDASGSWLTVSVEEVLKRQLPGGAVGGTVTVEVHVAVGADEDGATVPAPEEDYLWFLMPGDDDGVWFAASVTGVLGPGQEGPVTTVLQPRDTELVVPRNVRTLEAAITQAGLARG